VGRLAWDTEEDFMPMSRTVRAFQWAAAIATVVGLSGNGPLFAQGGPHGRSRMMGDASDMADMSTIHELLDNGAKVTRTVTMRPDGVETLTESDDPALAKTIQAHVVSMYGRVAEGRPIHIRDPLFRAIFEHASQITMAHHMTPRGIRVTETSTDLYVVKLQAHAEVLNAFIKNGRTEAMKNHDVPAR
jgi:hypothetical protein